MKTIGVLLSLILAAFPISAAYVCWYLFSIEGQIAQCERATRHMIVSYERVNERQAPKRMYDILESCPGLVMQQRGML